METRRLIGLAMTIALLFAIGNIQDGLSSDFYTKAIREIPPSMEPTFAGLVAYLASNADLPHFAYFEPPYEYPPSTLPASPSEVSVVVFNEDVLRQVWEPSITLVILGCGTFKWNDPGTQTVALEDDDEWRFAVDLQAVGCTLPPGRNMVMAVAETVSSVNIGSDRRANSAAWTFNVSEGNEFVVPLNPPQALEVDGVDPNWGSSGREITLRGTGFIQPSKLNRFQGSRVHFLSSDGTVPADTTVVDNEELRFTVPSSLPCGGYMLQVRNPDTVTFLGSNVAYQSPPVGFEIQCIQDVPTVPTPEIVSLNPDHGPPGASITVNGSGFLASNGDALSAVLWDGEPLDSAEYVGETQLRFKLPLFASCGEHEVQVRNPGPQFNSPPIPSNATTFTVACDDQAPPLGEPIFDVTSLNVVGNPGLGATVQIQGEVANTGDASGTADIQLEVNGSPLGNATRSIDPNQQVTITSQPFSFDSPGNYTFQLRTQNDQMTRTVEIASGPGDGGSAPASPLQDLDTNGNCLLDTTEFLAAIDGWIDETISNDQFFQAIDAWIAQSNICTESAGTDPAQSVVRVALTSSRQAVQFQQTSNPVGRLSIQVFDLAGQPMFSGTTTASALSWNLRDPRGRRVPNGVYLYRVSRHKDTGPASSSAYRMFWVLR